MKLWRELVIFYLGGMLYMALELAWRGWSHGSMFLLGGCCFWLIGQLDARHPRWPILLQMLCGTGIIVALELAGGLVLNRWLGLGIWDYSRLPYALLGQICLPFALTVVPSQRRGDLYRGLAAPAALRRTPRTLPLASSTQSRCAASLGSRSKGHLPPAARIISTLAGREVFSPTYALHGLDLANRAARSWILTHLPPEKMILTLFAPCAA